MKKLIALGLAVLMVLSMAACTSSDPGDSQTQGQASVAAGTTAAPETDAPTDAPETTAAAVDFQELVLVDNESCTFKITGFEPDGLFGYTMKVYLENKTDLELMFSLDQVSVNGFMCDPFWAVNVTAGMKANEEISWFAEDFNTNGITTVTDIDMTVVAQDYNDWMADPLVNESFVVYPLGADAVQPYTRQSVAGEIVLVDNEFCTMIVTGFDPDNLFGYTMNVYLENKTDKELTFSTSDVAVNGFMCDPFWATYVSAGKRCNAAITWFEEDFTANGITTVESISLPVTVSDTNDWMADYLVDETFEINP